MVNNETLHYVQGDKLHINARMVKFILSLHEEEHLGLSYEKKLINFTHFIQRVSSEVLKDIYVSAVAEDGYCYMPEYEKAFRLLETELVRRGDLTLEQVNGVHKRTAVFTITQDETGSFIDTENGASRTEIIERYSRMKFGSQQEIDFFAQEMAWHFIQKIIFNKDGLSEYFKNIKAKGEHIVMLVPGVRNVQVSANMISQRALTEINTFLALNDLPTIVYVTLPRLASDKSNYAELTQEQRASLSSVTQTQVPGKEFFEHGVHVIFADDVRITGSTADRIRKLALDAGALSFREIYAVAISPDVSTNRPEIEHELNTTVIKGALDDEILAILHEPDFQPVQRLVRLILDKKNR